jgi:hypothetical protein
MKDNPGFNALVSLMDDRIARHVRSGKMGHAEAMSELMKLSGDPEVQGLLLRPDEVMFQPEEDRLPALNPLYAAQIVERLQFDGDIPELRQTSLPPGAQPAVPVDTEALNPVALGQMLKDASEGVKREVEDLRHPLKSFDGGPGIGLIHPPSASGHISTDFPLAQIDVPDPEGYQRNTYPALRKQIGPSGSELATFSEEERHLLAWKALSSTQGRRSSVSPIRKHLLLNLAKSGLSVQMGKVEGEPLVEREWVMKIDGPKGLQSNFSPVSTARAALLKGLLENLPEEHRESPLFLVVHTVDTISDRIVGWSASLYLGESG